MPINSASSNIFPWMWTWSLVASAINHRLQSRWSSWCIVTSEWARVEAKIENLSNLIRNDKKLHRSNPARPRRMEITGSIRRPAKATLCVSRRSTLNMRPMLSHWNLSGLTATRGKSRLSISLSGQSKCNKKGGEHRETYDEIKSSNWRINPAIIRRKEFSSRSEKQSKSKCQRVFHSLAEQSEEFIYILMSRNRWHRIHEGWRKPWR